MNAVDFARLLEAMDGLSARQVEDLQEVLASLGLRIEALRQVESRVSSSPACGRCAASGAPSP